MSDDTPQDRKAWTFGHAYELLLRALQCAIRWIETSTNIDGVTGATLEAQATALVRGWAPTRRWAQAVATAVCLADHLLLPLRPGESVRLKIRQRTHSSDFSSVRVRMRRPVTGQLVDFFYHDGSPGEYPVALYKLYVMQGGARDILLSSGGEGAPPCATFYVPRGGGGISRLDFSSLERMLAWCLHLAEIDMGLTGKLD